MASDWLATPRLTTFTTYLNAADVQYGGGRYKRLSSAGYDVCFSTPSHSSCIVVDQSPKQTACHGPHDSTVTAQAAASHYERLQSVSGGSLDQHQRRMHLISQNPVMSLRRLHSSTSQSRNDDDDDDVIADEVD